MKKTETTLEDIQCAQTVPEVVHLNIGMQGKLYTYHLEQAAPAKKKRGPKPKIKLKSKSGRPDTPPKPPKKPVG